MLEKEAIQHLQDSANMVQMEDKLTKKNTNTPTMLVPKGFEIKVLEQFMKNRASYRVSYGTDNINDFASYSEEFDQVGAKCFIDSNGMSAKIIFDIGTEELPGHQLNCAKLKIEKTAAYEKLLDLDGRHLSQKNASNFIEDWADFCFITARTGESMTTAQAVNSLNKLTISEEKSRTSEIGGFSENMSSMEMVEAKNADKIPSDITFSCTPYIGLKEYEFTIRVSILTGSEKPEISFRIVQLEPTKEKITEEFKGILIDKFKGRELKTFIGSCS
jgi:uncharacterized protein YfdQ (DUF2303 family)